MSVVLLTWMHEFDLAKVINTEFRSRGIDAKSFQCIGMTLDGILEATRVAKMCIWWSWMTPPLDIATEFVEQTRDRITHVMFNTIDPFCWTVPENDMAKRAALFSYALVSSRASADLYAAAGCKAITMYLPVDASLFTPHPDPTYLYDVCMLLTNFYDDATTYPNQLWSRRSMLHILENTEDIKLGSFGNETVAEAAVKSYKGWCTYEDMAKVFKESRIVISTHVTNANEYVNRRCIEAMACGSIVMVDDIEGIRNVLQDGVVYLNKDVPLEDQVRTVLATYDTDAMQHVRRRAVAISTRLGCVKRFVDTCLSLVIK